MRLSKEQLSVIKDARELMSAEDGHPPRYICHAIGNVIKALQADGTLSEESAATLKHALSTAILAGINHMVTFGGFMLLTCPVLYDMIDRDEEAYDDTILMARLAWLDLIIETGEIKPELLLGEER